jgi:DNA uptake protein ComE-like DNA-binding protein
MTTTRRTLATALSLLLTAGLAGCADAGDETDAAQQTPGIGARPDTVAAAEDDALLDPNEADREELLALPGLDSAVVGLVLEGRPFDDMLALHQLLATRMDSAALDDVYRDLFIPLDLNSASEEEILLIPGVGPRMLHEFLEYRPYETMAQFRGEIGKYVDDDEVARLEKYVTIR